MKRRATRLKEMLRELNYWQGQVRMSIKSLQRTIYKTKEIAKKVRDIQKEP